MKAVQLAEFGVEHMQVAVVAEPSPGQGEVLIATEAATINPADFALATGAVAARLPWGTAPPYTPGWDLVGRVVAAGEGVAPSVVGSRVLGFSLWFESLRGTQAALVALPIGNVVPAPDGLPSAQLTTVGLNGLTAWRGLADLKLAKGCRHWRRRQRRRVRRRTGRRPRLHHHRRCPRRPTARRPRAWRYGGGECCRRGPGGSRPGDRPPRR